MANFNKSVGIVIAHEGGFVDNPKDRGGRTKYGITQRTLDNFLEGKVTADVANITVETAKLIYKENFWDLLKLDQIKSDIIPTVMFDLGVLMGPSRIVKITQSLLDEDSDGVMGPITLNAINAVSAEKSLALGLLKNANEHFFMLVEKDPTQLTFLKGWVRRLFSLTDLLID